MATVYVDLATKITACLEQLRLARVLHAEHSEALYSDRLDELLAKIPHIKEFP